MSASDKASQVDIGAVALDARMRIARMSMITRTYSLYAISYAVVAQQISQKESRRDLSEGYIPIGTKIGTRTPLRPSPPGPFTTCAVASRGRNSEVGALAVGGADVGLDAAQDVEVADDLRPPGPRRRDEGRSGCGW